MPKFIIRFDAGYGADGWVSECDTLEEAQQEAFEAWCEHAPGFYGAEEYTKERVEELGIEDIE